MRTWRPRPRSRSREFFAVWSRRGASLDDVVKTTVFIKNIDPDKVRTAGGAQAKAFSADKYPASTWVGVTGLVDPRLEIEVEATAVVAVD